MKSLARGYLWWPGMDKDIEECVKKCDVCQQTRKDPPAVPLHPWVWPDKPWTRVHIDYAGPLEENMFLLITDAHSKWIEIHATNSSTSSATIELLRKTFSSLGLPEVLVSDNATAFTIAEFSEFLQKNGICHVRTPPYHPASNGLVERAVQSFKEGMKRIRNFGTEGSVMYQIQLSDGRAVRRHAVYMLQISNLAYILPIGNTVNLWFKSLESLFLLLQMRIPNSVIREPTIKI